MSQGLSPTTEFQVRDLGGRRTSPLGLGCAMLSLVREPDEAAARRTILAALDSGISLVDTAAVYVPNAHSPNHNEKLVAAALREWGGPRDAVTVVTKGGHYRSGDAYPEGFPIDGRPGFIVEGADAALRALEVDVLDVLLLHWPDPKVAIADSASGLRQLLDAGKIRAAGLSNVSVEQLREAQAVCPIAVVQNPFSPDNPARDVFDVCAAEGIAFMAYSPLGGGAGSRTLAERHPEFGAVAQDHGVSAQQVTLAWEMALGPAMFPISGATRPETARDSAAAMRLRLEPDELARLNQAAFREPAAR